MFGRSSSSRTYAANSSNGHTPKTYRYQFPETSYPLPAIHSIRFSSMEMDIKKGESPPHDSPRERKTLHLNIFPHIIKPPSNTIQKGAKQIRYSEEHRVVYFLRFLLSVSSYVSSPREKEMIRSGLQTTILLNPLKLFWI